MGNNRDLNKTLIWVLTTSSPNHFFPFYRFWFQIKWNNFLIKIKVQVLATYHKKVCIFTWSYHITQKKFNILTCNHQIKCRCCHVVVIIRNCYCHWNRPSLLNVACEYYRTTLKECHPRSSGTVSYGGINSTVISSCGSRECDRILTRLQSEALRWWGWCYYGWWVN